MDKIPFNRPFIVGKELYYIAQTVMLDAQLSGNGEFTKKCQLWMEEKYGSEKALLTHSCTGALEMAAILCDIQPGDEIIMPSFTFVSTANAFVLRGGLPVFIDIKEDTLNIDENKIASAITKRTKAIVPVHYAGAPCNMEAIGDVAARNKLVVVEDAAQGLNSTYKGKMLGSIGHLGCLSFHETKNIISGEGGALLINDPKYLKRAETIWEKGTNRKEYLDGMVDRYTWVDIGSSFMPGELVAAFLYAQLECAEKIIENRTKIFKLYYDFLSPLAEKGYITLPGIDNRGATNGHIFYIITGCKSERDGLIKTLMESNIQAIFHYVPLHSSPAGRRCGRVHGTMKVTDKMSSSLLRLPLYYGIREADVYRVVEKIKDYYEKK